MEKQIKALLVKLEAEIEELKRQAAKEYKKPYKTLNDCWIKNSYVKEYHLSVSYIEAKEDTLRQLRGLND